METPRGVGVDHRYRQIRNDVATRVAQEDRDLSGPEGILGCHQDGQATEGGNLTPWVTNEFEHDGIRQSGSVFKRPVHIVKEKGGALT